MATGANDEERIMARGLKSPGPLLVVKKRLKDIDASRVRVIVSNRQAAEEIVDFIVARGGTAEIDAAGEDYHVVVDLARFEDVD
jgi:TusA-related sulfurtransferase